MCSAAKRSLVTRLVATVATMLASFRWYALSRTAFARARESSSRAATNAGRMLTGRLVDLVPLDRNHAADLFEAGAAREIFQYLPIAGFDGVGDVEAWIDDAVRASHLGRERPFAIVWKETGRAVGSTRYLEVTPEQRALEIGWTWLSKRFQRTGANVEAKYLMLRHAFEERGFVRVAFFTDAQNGRSRAALVRISATYEGTLRCHRAGPEDGFTRDSAAYSVIAAEWPAVRTRLEMKLRSTAPRLRTV